MVLLIAFLLFAYYQFWPRDQEKAPSQNHQEITETPQAERVEEINSPAPAVQKVEEKVELVVPKKITTPQAKYPHLDESFASFDEEGNRFIEQVNKIGRHLVYHGDVLVGDVEDLPRLMKSKVIKVGKSPKWPGGRIPFVVDPSIPQEEKVLEAVEYLNTFTNLKIVPRENEEDFVLITRGEEDCYSYAGRKGGKQEIFVVPQCGVRELIHEWMHTIGFLHEQNREDRDQYVNILWDNIDEINRPQFKKLPNDFMGVTGRPFDYQSIMLYSSETFSMHPGVPALLTVDGENIPRSENLLSDEDILRINLAYPIQ